LSALSNWSAWTAAFTERLRELDWIEGTTVAIAYRWSEGRPARTADLVAELVRLNVDVIVTHGTPNVVASQRATSTIPIVVAAADPGSGFVANLARPGGNVTGLSIQAPDLVRKRIQLLRTVVPGLRRLAIMAEVGDPSALLEMGEVQAAARPLSVEVVNLDVRRAGEIAPAFEAIKGQVDALYVCGVPVVNNNRAHINTLALAARIPTMDGFRGAVEAGALISYGPNFPELFRRAGDYVDKILRGTMPGELPVEQPTKFDLVVNLATAKAIGRSIPAPLLSVADAVIH
jgi:putative ABC transport system substrate-binding protein